MSTTLILLIISIIMIILVVLNLMKILPNCVDDVPEADWPWKWEGWSAWYTLGWRLDPLKGRKGFACWPSDQAPWYYNIRFMAFIQFMLWVVAKNFVPSTFNGFPILVGILASGPVLLRFAYLSFMLKRPASMPSTLSTVLAIFTLIGGTMLPLYPVVARDSNIEEALESNCHEIFSAAGKKGIGAAEVLKSFGIASAEDLKDYPSLNKCVQAEIGQQDVKSIDPDKFVKMFDELLKKMKTPNPNANVKGAFGPRQSGGAKSDAWHKHIISQKLTKEFESPVTTTELMTILFEQQEEEEVIAAIMDFNIPVPYMPWWRFGLSDIVFTAYFIISLLADLIMSFLNWPIRVPKSLDMVWNAIPTYYAVGGSNETSSNIFYLIYLFRLEILIAAIIGLIIVLIANIGGFIMKNISTVMIVILGIMMAGTVVALFTDLLSYAWIHALRYPFYVLPMWLFKKMGSFFSMVFGGFFGEMGEIIGLFADMIFGNFI
ncbi:MAG: hypothetical protein ACXABD_01200 [Candidatus Thorarchaeota archaeon]|jgi:hypothetical protein